MKRPEDFTEIYLCREPLDFRRGKEMMIAIIEEHMKKKTMGGALFGFTNRRGDRIRCLYWDKSGFAQWSKILERARFSWPRRGSSSSISLTTREFEWLLDGIDLDKVKPHESFQYELNS
jgi:transposase